MKAYGVHKDRTVPSVLISLRFSLLSLDYNETSVEFDCTGEKSTSCSFSTLFLKTKGSAISYLGSSSLHVFPDVSGHLSLSCSMQSEDLSLFNFFPLCSFLPLGD